MSEPHPAPARPDAAPPGRPPGSPRTRLARWTVRHTHGPGEAAGLFLGIGLALAAAAAAGFALLSREVGRGATQRLDESVVGWMRGYTAPWLDWLAILGAVLGSAVVLWAVLAVGTLVLLRRGARRSALFLWVSLAGGVLLNRELKALFDRPRPLPIDWRPTVFGHDVAFPTSPSFPSGHALTAMVVFGTLALLLVRHGARPRARRGVLAAAALLIALIGASRIYLGVHYPSDVLAGYLAGFVWIWFAAGAVEVTGRAYRRRAARSAG